MLVVSTCTTPDLINRPKIENRSSNKSISSPHGMSYTLLLGSITHRSFTCPA
jgi:hypothetical protein